MPFPPRFTLSINFSVPKSLLILLSHSNKSVSDVLQLKEYLKLRLIIIFQIKIKKQLLGRLVSMNSSN